MRLWTKKQLKPLETLSSPKKLARFEFSMTKNLVTMLFGSITEFESLEICSILRCLSLFNEWTTLTVELPATMVVALSHGENLV